MVTAVKIELAGGHKRKVKFTLPTSLHVWFLKYIYVSFIQKINSDFECIQLQPLRMTLKSRPFLHELPPPGRSPEQFLGKVNTSSGFPGQASSH